MSDKPPVVPPSPATAQPSSTTKGSPFNQHFQRPRPAKQPKSTGGRVLPPAPAWMMKPLKPPGMGSRG